MPLTLRKRDSSPFWYIRGSVNGISVFQSTKTSDKRLAEKYLAEYQSQLLRATKKTSLTFYDAATSYKSFGGDDRFLDKPIEALGQIPLEHITQAVIDRAAKIMFTGYQRKRGGIIYPHSNATIRRQFYVPVAAIMHHADKHDMCKFNRLELPTVKRPPPQWADFDYLNRLWSVCEGELYVIAHFLPLTGCRLSECLNLLWDDVDLDQGMAWIKKTKNGIPRMVHLPPDLASCMRTIQGEGRVFNMTKDWLRSALRSACKRAGIEYLSSHKLGSHTYATLMMREAGMTSRQLVGTGRWKSESAVNHYLHTIVSEEAKKSDIISSRAQSRADLNK